MSLTKQPPPAKVHLDAEIKQAVAFLAHYRDVYEKDHSDAGLVYLLIGYQNYLNVLPSGASAVNALKAAGFV